MDQIHFLVSFWLRRNNMLRISRGGTLSTSSDHMHLESTVNSAAVIKNQIRCK